jgi:sulfite dehydrogenase (quinone) subunit SoeA
LTVDAFASSMRGFQERAALSPSEERIELSRPLSDEVKYTSCYMCACRCGIKVHLKDGRIRYIEGNRDHPVNRGVLCAKGSAGLMTHYSPARLSTPLLRVGPRGSGEFKEIGWDEAMTIAAGWLGKIRARNPRELAFFTGRDQSQALTGWWAQQFGTPNYAAHGGFCSVNMAAAGLYTLGSSFWEFGEPDWERTRYFVMFGVTEDHDSNPIKIGLGKLKGRGAKFLSVNPVKTGYSAIADEWLGINPGTDGLFVLALVHELLRLDRIDLDFLARYTNAPWLVVRNPGGPDDGLFARDIAGRPLCWDRNNGRAIDANAPDASPIMAGEYRLPDGRLTTTVFQLVAERYLDASFSPESVAGDVGISAAAIRRVASELAHAAFAQEIVLDVPWVDWAGRRQERMIGRPISMHAMRGISAHSNGFHTCRAIHLLQLLLGSVDCPGGWRYKPPFPRPIPPVGKPTADARAGTSLGGPVLGFPTGPADLLVDADGTPRRIDKAFSWEAPLAIHGLMHMVIRNAWARDPYPIDTLFLYMTNLAWNSAMNTPGTMAMLTERDEAGGDYRIPRIIYSDAYYSEMVAYADLVLPDTTYLERYDCISLLDRPISHADQAADAIRQPVLAPERDVRPFQDVLIDLGQRLGLPGLVNLDGSPKFPGLYPDYIVNHQRRPGIGMLAGWRGVDGGQQGKGEANPNQLHSYIANGCFWRRELSQNQAFFRHANKHYLDWAVSMGFIEKAEQIVLQLYSEVLQKFRLAAQGHGPVRPTERDRSRIATYFDPLPFWYRPLEQAPFQAEEFPLHAISQRPMAMYHSWGSHNAWLRQIHGSNRLFLNRRAGEGMGLKDDDWVWVESPHGRLKVQVRLMEGVNESTVWTWNAIGKRAGAWNLSSEAAEAKRGFLLNHVISELLPEQPNGLRYSNTDPVTGQAAWYDLKVRIVKAAADETLATSPQFPELMRPAGIRSAPRILRYGAAFRGRSETKR